MSRPMRFLVYLCFSLGFLILLHQYILHGVLFEIGDIHHETFSIAFFSLGLGILLGTACKTGKP
ncbi:MAG: hypothetical protein NWE91_04395 [Candidatus Bathyarchaeota archaeon]|nr:hypothetical protein [Candidatus Bathyarchaeota archaeon]